MCTQELRGSSRVLSEKKSMPKDKTPYSIYTRFMRQHHLEMEMELVVSEDRKKGRRFERTKERILCWWNCSEFWLCQGLHSDSEFTIFCKILLKGSRIRHSKTCHFGKKIILNCRQLRSSRYNKGSLSSCISLKAGHNVYKDAPPPIIWEGQKTMTRGHSRLLSAQRRQQGNVLNQH